ncbi:hypothetical protein IJJ97_00550 [bacterium]|nr:hypothetical protein [bacterium]
MYQIIFYCVVAVALAFIVMTLIGIQDRLDDIGRIADIMEYKLKAEGANEVPTKKKVKKDKEDKKDKDEDK